MTDTSAGGWPVAAPAEVAVEAGPELQLTVEQKNAYIKAWLGWKNQKAYTEEMEKGARDTMVGALFPNPTKGTQRFVSPEGFGSIKLVYGWTYTLGHKDKVDANTGLKVPVEDQANDVLDAIEKLGERGKFLAARVFRFKPELVVSEYEALCASDDPDDAKAKELIDSILTVKPASPQCTFEPPK